ncbi:unnamed protein product [Bemisia tabaci]|uniref:Uncharacterized protein n=1 Tax=Bemisia tabaci TaxID=7038 RepID=A0A9P0CAD7_BEMTA|nr:unnamed protein product [Bemisia tabaci]
MFGGLGGALKNLGGKAEELIEKKKKEVEELAAEKKNAAASMIENQIKKTGDSLWQAKSDAEKTATAVAEDNKKAAIEAFDAELKSAEKTVDETIQETKSSSTEAAPPSEPTKSDDSPVDAITKAVGGLDFGKIATGGLDATEAEKVVDTVVKQVNTAVDEKIKEADHFIDEKREDVVHKAQEAISGATAGSGVGAMLGKAKGLLGSK